MASQKSLDGQRKEIRVKQYQEEFSILGGLVKSIWQERKKKKAEKKAAQTAFKEEIQSLSSNKTAAIKKAAPILFQVAFMAGGLIISRGILSKFRK